MFTALLPDQERALGPLPVSDLRTFAGLKQRNGLHHEAQQNLDRARDIETRHSKAARQNGLKDL